MKKLSARERLILTFLPGIVLMGLYYFFISSPLDQSIADLRRRTGVLQERLPSPQEVQNISGQLNTLRREVSIVRDALRQRSRRGEEVLEYWTNPDFKALSGEKLGELLAENRVVLIEEIIAEEDDRKRFAKLTKMLPDSELWLLRVAGTYDSIRRTIETLGETDLPVVPAAIEMEPLYEGSRSIHLWNIWICR